MEAWTGERWAWVAGWKGEAIMIVDCRPKVVVARKLRFMPEAADRCSARTSVSAIYSVFASVLKPIEDSNGTDITRFRPTLGSHHGR